MRHYTKHMSDVQAAAIVHGAEAIANCIKACEREGDARLFSLRAARDDLDRWFADVDAAIAKESLALAEAAE